MELSIEDKKTQEESIKYIRSNKQELIEKFVTSKNPLKLDLITIFMAGSPGAGKTEFSKRYLPTIANEFFDINLTQRLKLLNIDIHNMDNFIIRIDVDEIREFIPQYCKTDKDKGIKGNSQLIQRAANEGLNILRNYCLENEISFLHDGTFGNYDTMEEIIKRSIKQGREVQLFYLYMDPIVAWRFTQAREYLEGRNIGKANFVDQFFKSQENVGRIKQKFKDKIKIHFVLKNNDNTVAKIEFNSQNIRQLLTFQIKQNKILEYTKEDLLKLLI